MLLKNSVQKMNKFAVQKTVDFFALQVLDF